jgi:DNA-3-methyladenine glycosylase II
MIKTLDEKNLIAACEKLSKQDADLQYIYETHGTPPLWKREANFATLLHIILEQQVSLASALSAFNKLHEKLNGEITPENVLKLSDAEMKAAYFSRQKTVYARDLAAKIIEGNLDVQNLKNLSDEAVKVELKRVKGIGDWTSDIYLLMALMRPDVMPKGDLALHIAWQKISNLETRPNADEFLIIAERWKPFRAIAARLLWHFYLSVKKI